MSQRYIMLFTRFERFWHWSQMLLIMILLFTGFGIHGFHQLLDFQTAVELHTVCAASLLILWIFAIFWHLTTGTWRHYVPTTNGLWKVAKFYAFGIFKGERHPYHKAYWRKHNPLQAISYLALKLFLFPAIWISGIAYLLYPLWAETSGGQLIWVAIFHTVIAFAILAFVIIHVYLLTTGHSFKAHVMPMINGFDKVELSSEEEAYLEKDEPGNIR
ncbi:cytochrome b/b6 domain-containing protein [Candidatus Venteria ishoeyi]|uniref:Prokaryotic cytochrome b561 n=1 Tax=Candidatus Venteria ishoeyi TaxID=1899563 RepID=A0A1H6F982_9GAMM|nr:cytochrome b/b6 domain-containing protein [Candidatus Venteria ishoeyi]SEH05676.1 Prokaryotic cytochrome b561 [Candidatus Venteria ishoeyi]